MDKIYLQQQYLINRMSCQQIANLNKCSVVWIWKLLKKHNIATRPTSEAKTKNNQFWTLNSINSSYWAGWFGSDGCIHEKENFISLDISSKDRTVLENFKTNIQYSGNIYDYIKNNKHYSKLSIYGANKLIQDLRTNFNITSRKSLTLQPPNLTNLEHQLAYIIGYIDGDGCICISKDRLLFNIVGTNDILTWISQIFNQIELNYNIKNPHKTKNKNSYILEYSQKRAWLLLNILDKIKVPFKLKRKWSKIKEYESQNINKIISWTK